MQTKWKRSLGTSKREQGIVTPKAPQNRPRFIKSMILSHGPVLSPFGMIMDFFKDKTEKILKPKRKKVEHVKPAFVDKTSKSRIKTFHQLRSQKGK